MSEPNWRDRAFEDVSSYTNSGAPLWLQRASQWLLRSAGVGLIRQATRPNHPIQRAVDVGCGVGEWTRAYAEFCRRVVGLDVNASFIDEARRRTERSDVDGSFEFRVSDGVDPQLLEHAGLIAFGSVFQYMKDERVKRTLQQSGDAQAPGDVVYLRTTVVSDGGDRRAGGGVWYRRPQMYRDWLQASGYAIEIEKHSAELIGVERLRRIVPGLSAEDAARWISTLATPLDLLRSDDGGLQFMNWMVRRQ